MNISKNPMPFYPLDGNIWTNYKPLWHINSAYCSRMEKDTQVYYPGVHHFQLKIEKISEVQAIELRLKSDNTVVNGLTINSKIYYDKNGDRYLVINIDLLSALIGSQYYVSIETSTGFYYSEIFCVNNNKNDRVALIYAAEKKIGNLVYENGYRNVINLDSRVVLGSYELEEEVEENGFGEEQVTLQKLTQSFNFSALVPNYLAEALSSLKMHSQFRVIDYYNNKPYQEGFDSEIKSLNTTVTPEDDGCNSLVDIEYKTQSIIVTGCTDQVFEEVLSTPGSVLVIYDEGAEWEYVTYGDKVDDQNQDHVSSGDFAILFNNATESAGIFFVNPLQIPLEGLKLNFDLKLHEVHDYSFIIRLLNTDTNENSQITIDTNKYGIDPNNLNFQTIAIPFSEFGLTHFTQLSFYIGYNPNNFEHNFSIDNITIDEI